MVITYLTAILEKKNYENMTGVLPVAICGLVGSRRSQLYYSLMSKYNTFIINFGFRSSGLFIIVSLWLCHMDDSI